MQLLLVKPGWILLALLIPALWLLAHPLLGVRHDAVLYLGQALARLQPQSFQSDLFLSLSGQDRFTLATTLTSWLYTWVSVGIANAGLLLISQALSATLLFCLIRPMVGTAAALAGMVLYACASHGYGPEQTFSFAEPFLTARSLAEPMFWAALLAWSRSRWLLALALLAGASVMHPLIALPGWVAAFCWLLRRDRRWVGLMAPIVLLMLWFAFTRWPPQLVPFDADWLRAIEERNAIFVHQMDMADWCKALFPALVIIMVVRRRLKEAALPLAVLDAAVLLVGAAAITADLLRLVLPTQLQLWRALWPMQALGLVLLPGLVLEQTRNASPLRWSSRLAAMAALTAVNVSVPSAPWLVIWWVLLQLAPGGQVSRFGARAAMVASTALLVSAVAWSVEVLSARAQGVAGLGMHQLWIPWLATPAISLLLFSLVWRLVGERTWLTAAVGMVALLASAAIWDQRSLLLNAVEGSRAPASHPWQSLIPEQTPVLWPAHPEAAWALLQRPVFHDEVQGAASVFNRELAIKFAHQREYFSVIRQAEIQCRLQHLLLRQPGQLACATPIQSLGALCGHVPGMRFFVGTERWSPAWVSTWRLSDASTRQSEFHLHDCERLQALAPLTAANNLTP